jgi:hypothetical protein
MAIIGGYTDFVEIGRTVYLPLSGSTAKILVPNRITNIILCSRYRWSCIKDSIYPVEEVVYLVEQTAYMNNEYLCA